MDGFYLYRAWDGSAKRPMTSHVIVDNARIVLIDPLELSEKDLQEIGQLGVMDCICLTSHHHLRFTPQLRKKFNVRIYAHASVGPEIRIHVDKTFDDLDLLPGDLTAIHIPGASPTETAFFLDKGGGVMIVGNALVRARDLDFPSGKLCQDPIQNRESLRKLLIYEFKTLCFGHGEPMHGYPRAALRNLMARPAAAVRAKKNSK